MPAKLARRLAVSGVLLTVSLAAPLLGQQTQVLRTASNQQDRGQFMDGLVRDLVNSQMSFQPAPLEPVAAANVTVEMQRARQQLQRFSQQADGLVNALRFEERYSPSVRPLLASMLQVKAYADALIQQTQTTNNSQQVVASYAELDRSWRLVAYQVRQMPNMGNTVLQWVDAVNQVNDQLGQMLKIDPQLNRDELAYTLVTLRADLDHLGEDISVDLFGHADQAQLTQQVQSLRGSAQQFQLAVENRYPYEYLSSLYQDFFSQWNQLKLKLRQIDNRYVQRHVSRITTLNERLHELLWLPPVVDGNEILYLAESLKSNVDHVAAQISLRTLLALPTANEVFSRARDFWTLCDEFRKTVARETQFDNVRWDFRELDVAWNDLRTVLIPLNDPDTNRLVAFIDQSVMELRTALGLHSQINRDEALRAVATLDSMTDLLNYDLTQTIGTSSAYTAQFRRQALESSQALRTTVRQLYASVARDPQDEATRAQMQKLATDWNRLIQVVNKVRAEDRATIARTVHQISPAVATLQVVLAYQ